RTLHVECRHVKLRLGLAEIKTGQLLSRVVFGSTLRARVLLSNTIDQFQNQETLLARVVHIACVRHQYVAARRTVCLIVDGQVIQFCSVLGLVFSTNGIVGDGIVENPWFYQRIRFFLCYIPQERTHLEVDYGKGIVRKYKGRSCKEGYQHKKRSHRLTQGYTGRFDGYQLVAFAQIPESHDRR